jgi:predicted transglutaminase-like cysteine proteinase
MRLLKQMWSARSIAAALLGLAILGASGTAVLAKSKGQTGIFAQDPTERAIASSNVATPQFFTINEVLAQRAAGTSTPQRPIRLASIEPAGLRGAFSEFPHNRISKQTAEPFGVLAFRAPEGLLWTKWRALTAKVDVEVAALSSCRADPDHCEPEAKRFNNIVAAAKAKSGRARFEHVNQAVNSAIRYTSDPTHHGVPDLWSAPLASFASGRGDCEDYAIAKYVALREAGVAAEDLKILLAIDRSVGEAHAVLAARHEGAWSILDNRRPEVLEDKEIGYFTPLFVVDQQGVKLLATPYRAATHPINVPFRAPAGHEKLEVGTTASDQTGPAGSGVTITNPDEF